MSIVECYFADSILDIDHLNQTTGDAILYSTSEPHNATNLTFYDEAVTQVWPLILIQSPAEKYNGDGGVFSSQMSCMRASNFSEGSQKVTDVPGASSHVQISIWSLMGVAAAITILL
jgi:hypothetical protein